MNLFKKKGFRFHDEEMLAEAERFIKRMKEYLLEKGISLPNENNE